MQTPYADHFTDCRVEFYCAEGLKRFSRDLFEHDEFATLLDMVLKGVRTAVSSPRHRAGDLPGTCHHLVNEKKLRWVK
ncbi:ABC-three component system protein [Paraburkholderia aspalathi]|uniref:ABC-three component system protein n=1 Tax=Paraburkholderia aspalathi TaxID=1324617 RepID=UPI0038B7FCE9